MSFQGQGHRLGGPRSGTGPPPPPTAVAAATTPADLRNIPVAEVVSGPPAGSGSSSSTSQQASVPNAQMAYMVRAPQPQPMAPDGRGGGGSGGGVVVLDPQLARYLAQQEGGAPPAPPDYLPLTVCSCFCCWPLALVGIYYSRLVRFFYARGQYLQAYEASRRAKQMGMLAMVLGSISIILYYFLLQKRRGLH